MMIARYQIFCSKSKEDVARMVKFLIQNEDKYYTVEDSSLSEVSIFELNAQALVRLHWKVW